MNEEEEKIFEKGGWQRLQGNLFSLENSPLFYMYPAIGAEGDQRTVANTYTKSYWWWIEGFVKPPTGMSSYASIYTIIDGFWIETHAYNLELDKFVEI
jgi:hypothetical protein